MTTKLDRKTKKQRVAEMWKIACKQGGAISRRQYREIVKDGGAIEKTIIRYEDFELPKIADHYEIVDRRRAFLAMKAAYKEASEPVVSISELKELWDVSSKSYVFQITKRIKRRGIPFPCLIDDRPRGGNGNRLESEKIKVDFTPRDGNAYLSGIEVYDKRPWYDKNLGGICWIAEVR